MENINKEPVIIYNYSELKSYVKKMLDGILDDVSTHRFLKMINECEVDGYSLEETIELIQYCINESIKQK